MHFFAQRITLCCISILFIFSAHSEKRMPSYDSLLFKLYSEYEITPSPVYYYLAKTKNGCEVYTMDYGQTPPKMSPMQLFWNSENGKYEKLDLQKREQPIIDVSELQSLGYFTEFHRSYGFERCPYYGYPQWSWDVIADYGNKTDLDIINLEGLSRAYSIYSQGFLNGTRSPDNANTSSTLRNFNPDTFSISQEHVDSFLYYRLKGIEHIKMMVKIDPDYAVVVGNMRTKLANEYMDIFLNLAQNGYRSLALEYLNMAEYDPSMLSYARNMLSACPQNAVMLSNGDNDIYPVLYTQLKFQYRNDVSAINLSLMPLRKHRLLFTGANSLFNPIHAAAFDARKHLTGNTDYIMVGNDCPDNLPIANEIITHFFNQENNPSQAEFACNKVGIYNADSGLHQYKFPGYALVSDIYLLDMVQTSGRPLQYNLATGDEAVVKWIGQRTYGNGYGPHTGNGMLVDSAAITTWLLKDFQPVLSGPATNCDKDATIDLFTGHYLHQFSIAIAWSALHADAQQTDKLIEMALSVFPDKMYHPNNDWWRIIALLLKLKNYDEASTLLSHIEAEAEVQKQTKFGEKTIRNLPALVPQSDPLYQMQMLIYEFKYSEIPESFKQRLLRYEMQ